MSDRKSLTLPFFFVIAFFLRHYLFSLSPLLPLFLFSSLSLLLPFSSVFVITFFCFRHSVTNYKVIQDAEVNNQKTNIVSIVI